MEWRGSLPPVAPCRRPGCGGSVYWKGVDAFARGSERETQDLFCTAECEEEFWATREGRREEIQRLLRQRQESTDLRGAADGWDEQFNLVWWHQARYMGVRRFATSPQEAAWHEHYYALG
ncbi:hypothetical protein N798_00265 [Knoellia flava TL1]|nr:hypothetical protein N798_00265 [Knoellia flava TL1]